MVMYWGVGFDLRAGCDGPAYFAAWLVSETASRGTGDRAAAIHIVEENSWQYILPSLGLREANDKSEDLKSALSATPQTDLIAASQNAVATQLDRTGTRKQFSAVHVLPQTVAEVGLAQFAEEAPGTGLIIGRRSRANEDRFIRLGRVARKLLRRLPSPVIVTPPDLVPKGVGDGPIVVATDCGDDSVAACAFAANLAKRLGRKLCLVHVVSMPDAWDQEILLKKFAAVRKQVLEEGEKLIDTWIDEQGLAVDERVVAVGDVVVNLNDLATSRRAPFVVCGSRKLGTLARVFVNSVASELAAASKCPVAVVPPDFTVEIDPPRHLKMG